MSSNEARKHGRGRRRAVLVRRFRTALGCLGFRLVLVLTASLVVLLGVSGWLAVTLHRHQHEKAVEPYNHVNLGFTTQQLEKLSQRAGLKVQICTVSAIEKRIPYFSVLSLSATKP